MNTSYCTLIFIVLCNFSLTAQEWFEDGAKWHYTHFYFVQPIIDFNVIEVVGDTILQGIECKILTRQKASCDIRPGTEIMYEDAEKIYFWNYEDQEFKLLYDFTKEVGETWQIDMWFEDIIPEEEFVIVRVDSIKMIIYGDQELKTWYITYTNYEVDYLRNDVLVDKIGSINKFFPFEFQLCDAQYDRGLRCFQNSEMGLIHFTDEDCEEIIITSTEEEILEHSINVYPNPTNDIFSIENRSNLIDVKSVTVFSTNGQVLERIDVQQSKNQNIALYDYSSGVYFLQIELENEQIIRRKIIKK